MGWTSYHVEPIWKKGKSVIDRKAACDELFNCEASGGVGKYEVLKSAMVGSTYYAAVKRTVFATATEPEKTIVFAAVCLTRVDSKDHFNFSYKDMDETCGPCEYDCPASILKLLTPTDSDWAKEWREKCWNNIEEKKFISALNSLPIGTVIRFKAPYEASMYKEGDEVILTKKTRSDGKSSYWVNERYFYSLSFIGKDYDIVFRP